MKKEENIYSVRAQEIQDEIFRKMTAGQKLKLASKFYRFAQNLRKNTSNGTRRTAGANRRNFK